MQGNIFDWLFTEIWRFQAFGYGIIFFISVLESLALVGLLIPGTTITVIFGLLAAEGEFGVFRLMVFSALGAMVGDGLSYWLGRRGLDYFKHEQVWLKKVHLDQGREFFEKHGPKSVFLGRFIGPLRPLVPFVAGMMRMRLRTFFFWNISSAIAWSIAFVSIGYFFGNAWRALGAWHGRIGAALIICLAVVVVVLARRWRAKSKAC